MKKSAYRNIDEQLVLKVFDNQLDLLIDANSKFLYNSKSQRILVDLDVDFSYFRLRARGGYIDVDFKKTLGGIAKRRSVARFLLGLTGTLTADHINRNTLDNRRSNLRAISKIDNLKNKGKYYKILTTT